MDRIPEPELMEDEIQAIAYGQADFEEPNAAYVQHLLARFPQLPPMARVADLGCGPADIALRLARRFPGWQLDALDGSAAMLEFGKLARAQAGLQERVRLVQGCVPAAPLPDAAYDLVLSNSLLHHLHEPLVLWREIRRLGKPGARVLVADLFRPQDEEAARRIVETYSGDEPEILKRDFFLSLRAAFEPREVRAQLDAVLPELQLEVISDRHLLVWGQLA